MSKVFFIAEAGKNFIDHDWKQVAFTIPYYAERAISLIKAAKEAGADAVKFQTHVFEDEQHLRGESRYDWIKFNESITPVSFWKELKMQCDHYGIEFMTTPMSKMAAEKVNEFVTRWKVGSGSVTDHELLRYMASTGKPVILSTGMSTQKQVQEAVDLLTTPSEAFAYCGKTDISLLYCKSIYPCPLDRVDLGRMYEMNSEFKLPVGFSDHTVEITTPMRAAIYDAEIIEKHFTMDKNAFGPDHSFALTPDELKIAVQLVRDYEDSDNKDYCIIPDDDEIKYWKNFRKVVN